MKTKTIEIKVEKTVNVLETKDFIDFLEDNRAMDKFREACLKSDDDDEKTSKCVNRIASEPDFVRNYIRFVLADSQGNPDWFQRLLIRGFIWRNTGEWDFWADLCRKWQNFCEENDVKDFEI